MDDVVALNLVQARGRINATQIDWSGIGSNVYKQPSAVTLSSFYIIVDLKTFHLPACISCLSNLSRLFQCIQISSYFICPIHYHDSYYSSGLFILRASLNLLELDASHTNFYISSIVGKGWNLYHIGWSRMSFKTLLPAIYSRSSLCGDALQSLLYFGSRSSVYFELA